MFEQNIEYRYSVPGTVKPVMEWSDTDGNIVTGSLSGLRKKLVSFFNENSCEGLIQVFWIDFAVLINDETITAILAHSRGQKLVPKIIIGTQDIETINSSSRSTKLFEKKINQFDNNIWVYYLKIEEWSVFEPKLKACVDKIARTYSRGFYSLTITDEYFEFYRRLVRENHLLGGHSSFVIPFHFTSKTIEYRKAKEKLKRIVEKIEEYFPHTRELKLKVLIADDFATETLRKKEEKDEGVEENKRMAFETLWKEFTKECNNKISIQIDAVDFTVKPTLEEQKNEYYDIILLDYNFNENKSGVDLIEEINEIADSKDIHGPFGRYWILPISSFSVAFADDMHNRGLGYISDKYEISRGADFINTPELFLHYFVNIIDAIIRRVTGMQDKIKELLANLNDSSSYDLRNSRTDFQKEFYDHMETRGDLSFIIKCNKGIVHEIMNDSNTVKFQQKLNFYEQLLYNLAYRNFAGNEEIVIYRNLLKNA